MEYVALFLEKTNSNYSAGPSNVSFIPFFVFGHFWQRSYENTKILCNLCLHFARQDGQDGKKQKENHESKVTKMPKTKRQKYRMNKTLNTC